MKNWVLGMATAVLLANSPCMGDELKVLSAGAMQRGLVGCLHGASPSAP